jgi:HEAT repeat protein
MQAPTHLRLVFFGAALLLGSASSQLSAQGSPAPQGQPAPQGEHEQKVAEARAWIRTLVQGELQQKREAAFRLSELGAFAALPLKELLQSNTDLQVRLYALSALRGMGAEAAPVLPVMMEFLQSDNADLRGLAINVLGQIGRPGASSAAPAVRKLWTDPSPNVQRVAISVYAALSEPSAEIAAELATRLKDPNPSLRGSAAFALGLLGPQALPQLDALLEVMKDPEDMVRIAAAQSVGQMGEEALGALLDFEKSAKDPVSREIAAVGLASVQPPQPRQIDVLVRMVYEPQLRKTTLGGLRKIGTPAFDAMLAEVERGKDPVVAKEMLETIGAGGKLAEEMTGRIAGLLDSQQPYVRWGAAMALARIGKGGEGVVPALEKALEDKLPPVRILALAALARIGQESEGVLPKLIQLLRQGGADQSYHVAEVMRIYGEDALPALDALVDALGDEDARVQQWAEVAISGIGAVALPKLREILESPQGKNKARVLRAIQQMGSEASSAAEWIVPLLESNDAEVCVAATRALTFAGKTTPDMLSRFAALLHRDEPEVQIAAVTALGLKGMGQPEFGPRIARLLESSNARVRRSAVEALGALGDAEVVAPLLGLLDDSDEHVRWRAAASLGALGARSKLGSQLRAVVDKLEALETTDSSLYVRPAARDALLKIRGG